MSTLTDFIPWLLDSGGCCGITYDAVLFNRVESTSDITISGTSPTSPTMIGSSFNVTFPSQGLFDIAAIQYRFQGNGSGSNYIGIGIKIGSAYIPAPVTSFDGSSANWDGVEGGYTKSVYAGFTSDHSINGTFLTRRVFTFDISGLAIGSQTLACQLFLWCSGGQSPVLKGSTLKTILGYRVGSLA